MSSSARARFEVLDETRVRGRERLLAGGALDAILLQAFDLHRRRVIRNVSIDIGDDVHLEPDHVEAIFAVMGETRVAAVA